MTKRCGRCRLVKNDDEFHRFRSGWQAWCKSCRREYDAAYWRKTRDERLRQRKIRRRDLAIWYREQKTGRPCTDCGGVFHHAAMHWDHLPGLGKKREVSNLVVRGFRRRTILEEISKCELVCANCHAVRTFDRFGV